MKNFLWRKEKQLEAEEKHCINCNYKLSWQNDFDMEDMGCSKSGIMTSYHCCNCGADIDVYMPDNPELE